MDESRNLGMTTIKLSKLTKDRLNKLKNYKRETYEELMQDVLNTLNLCKINPEKARAKLLALDRVHRKVTKNERQNGVQPLSTNSTSQGNHKSIRLSKTNFRLG